jgi:hypothetical protein
LPKRLQPASRGPEIKLKALVDESLLPVRI